MTINPFSIIFLLLALIIGIAIYVVEGLALFRMGRKAGVSWAWVAWIPGAQNFVMARMAKWKAWALFPTLTLIWAVFSIFVGMALMGIAASYVNIHQSIAFSPMVPLPPVSSMHPATVYSINSEPTTVMPGVLPVTMMVMPMIELIAILFAVFTMIQWGQVLERFGYSYAWLMWNFLPVFGTIVFFVILLRIAFRNEVQYQDSGTRTVFGSLIRGRL